MFEVILAFLVGIIFLVVLVGVGAALFLAALSILEYFELDYTDFGKLMVIIGVIGIAATFIGDIILNSI